MNRLLILAAALLLISPIASAQSISNAAEQEVLRIDKDWAEWFNRRDSNTNTILSIILADDYSFTSARGGVFTKAEYLKDQMSGVSLKVQDIKVRIYGDAAIVSGSVTMEDNRPTLTRQPAIEFDSVRYTNMYVKRPKRWELVSTQFTPIPKN